MGKKDPKKKIEEELARLRANQAFIDEVIRKRLERRGVTREEVFRRVGWIDPERDK